MSLFDYELPRIPEFCMSHWLLRIPLAIIFIQQGLMKIPVDVEEAASYGLSYLVWWFVAYGELLGGIGIIAGGILALRYINLWDWIGDMITRFSGITLCCIMTGVIWIVQIVAIGPCLHSVAVCMLRGSAA